MTVRLSWQPSQNQHHQRLLSSELSPNTADTEGTAALYLSNALLQMPYDALLSYIPLLTLWSRLTTAYPRGLDLALLVAIQNAAASWNLKTQNRPSPGSLCCTRQFSVSPNDQFCYTPVSLKYNHDHNTVLLATDLIIKLTCKIW